MAWNIRTSKQISPDLEILVNAVNVDVAASVVLDASTVAPDVNGLRELKAGTPLVKNENNQYQKYGATAELTQQVKVVGTGGTFTLTRAAETTPALAYNATAAQVEAALEAFTAVTDVEVQRTGSGTPTDPYVYRITYLVSAEAAAITATSSVTGTGAAVTLGSATTGILGILAHSVKFPDGTAKSDVPAAMWNHGQWFRSDRIVNWAGDSAAIKAALPTCKFS
jgi:hypothetical protein